MPLTVPRLRESHFLHLFVQHEEVSLRGPGESAGAKPSGPPRPARTCWRQIQQMRASCPTLIGQTAFSDGLASIRDIQGAFERRSNDPGLVQHVSLPCEVPDQPSLRTD